MEVQLFSNYTMFLNIDKKPRNKVAAIDDSGLSVTYGDICDFSKEYARHLPERSLIFLLSENKIGSLMGYTASLSNRIVPLILSARTEETLYNQLYERYQPAYLWLPDEMLSKTGFPVIFSAYGYSLVKT
jgi:hypothetical protein